ncbi:MAG: YabP/YqfC family sporulation protein [Clostridia bacterium]|nr:YabP/YqfC family sporulation protein [Clostridia bacterium]
MQENQNVKHTVNIEQRKLLTVTAVESVTAFSEVKIVLSLLGGGRLNVIGSGLKITGFSKSVGTFTAEGTVTGIQYGGKNFAAKIFK